MKEKEIDELIQKALTDESKLPKGLEQRIEQHINDLEATEKQKLFRVRATIMWAVGIAASLMLIISIGFYGIEREKEPQIIADTYSTPEEAALVAEKTLAFVAEKLNQGLAQAADAEAKIQKVNHIMENLK